MADWVRVRLDVADYGLGLGWMWQTGLGLG